MFSNVLTRVVALLMIVGLLGGCAEIDRRGGVIAQAEDFVLFTAHTKSHRLFRSYLLVGVLLAAARQGGHNDADKLAIEANMKAALDVAFEAHQCLYPSLETKIVVTENTTAQIGTLEALNFTAPAICQFFDEKMARLDYALYRLALTTLFNAEGNVQLSQIRDKLFGQIPVASETFKAAIHANKALNQATSLVDDLLNLSFSSAGPVLTLLPLYRDSLELNMWLIIDNLTKRCVASGVGAVKSSDGYYPPTYSLAPDAVCTTHAYAFQIMNNGNGDLRAWRDFVSNMNYVAGAIDAYPAHFFLVTKLMWRSCQSLLGDTSGYVATPDPKKNKCQIALNSALAQVALQADLVEGEGGRVYSAALERQMRLARLRQQRNPSQLTSRPSQAPVVRDSATPSRGSDTTGSISRPNATQAPAPSAR